MEIPMISRRAASALIIALLLLWPFIGAQACGPDFEPDIFVKENYPDNIAAFVQGHLGILQAHMDSDEYAVAYRYLNGGKLSDKEQAIAAPASVLQPVQDWTKLTPQQIAAAQAAERQDRTDSQPPGSWQLERAKYSPNPAPEKQQLFPTDYSGTIVFDPNYLNCPDPAFQNAVLTLNKRASAWGKQSPWLADWIQAQDAVFSNCAAKSPVMPASAPEGSPALLRADRAYQLASAALYAKQYDQAAQQFSAIAQDKSSPWKPWGEYLAARALVRKAFSMGKATDPYSSDQATFNLATMQTAQHKLEAQLAERNPEPSRAILQAELNFIRIRTEPEKRLTEICAALAGPAPDDNFAMDRRDLSYILSKNIDIANPPPLYAWIAAFRAPGRASDAYALWQKSHALPWLVMAIVNAEPSDPQAAALLAEAGKIKPDSPAYDTVFYHRIRLLIGGNRKDDARALLDKALPAMHGQPPSSNENSLLGERLSVARDYQEFLKYAPRKVIVSSGLSGFAIAANCNNIPASSEMPNGCPQKGDPPQLDHSLEFDEDSVYVLNRQVPLTMLAEAASSPNLPANLRQDLVLSAWTRSVVLEDGTTAAKLAPLLPAPLSGVAGTGFPATLAILRNPGLRPYLAPGLSRLASFNVLDNYRDNWWGGEWEGKQIVDSIQGTRLPLASFLSQSQQAAGKAEYERLRQLPYPAVLLGRRVIDYAKAHPDDPAVPEALALTVRATRFPSEDWIDEKSASAENSAISKAAFQLLHARYPKSLWAIRTRYYY